MPPSPNYVIETQGLSKTFGEVQALNGVDLQVAQHSIFGFIKPLLLITPWILGNSTELLVMGQDVAPEMMAYPLIAATFWCIIFTLVAVLRFEKTEF